MVGWWNAVWIAFAFVGGQLSTYLAFRLGDVSLATPSVWRQDHHRGFH